MKFISLNFIFLNQSVLHHWSNKTFKKHKFGWSQYLPHVDFVQKALIFIFSSSLSHPLRKSSLTEKKYRIDHQVEPKFNHISCAMQMHLFGDTGLIVVHG